jgi:4-oxalocrotonate tautomerase
MPLTRVSLRKGKPAAYRRAILEALYLAMRETFDVPEEDRFMTISEYDADDFLFSPTYLGITRSDELVTRSVEQKKALFRRIVERLTANPGLRPEDVFINLVEVAPANWSFGHGVAQYVAGG